jgi:hypothetical protein
MGENEKNSTVITAGKPQRHWTEFGCMDAMQPITECHETSIAPDRRSHPPERCGETVAPKYRTCLLS